MSIFDAIRNIFDASQDTIDAYFIQSELKDINLTPAERSQTAHYDSMASETTAEGDGDDVPLGKQVW